VVHLLPPRGDLFFWERLAATLARTVHGLGELLAFSLLRIGGLHSPLAMFLTLSGLGVLAGIFAYSLRRSCDEAQEILLIAVIFNLAFGAWSAYVGDLPVGRPAHCETVSSVAPAVRVTVYTELGWTPGAHYFLSETNPEGGAWRQTGYAFLQQPIEDPCEHLDLIFSNR
jgi:hypothetical protein